jgi:hypothetical protein
VTDGKKLAVLLQWRDELPQNTAIRVQDFQDGAALQFSLSGKYGFLGMGDKENPVNLWNWKAGWQAEAEGGGPPDMDSVYQSMHVDAWKFTNYSTAVSAGNVISQPHKSPVEDANAAGFGSFRSQPLKQQNVAGQGRLARRILERDFRARSQVEGRGRREVCRRQARAGRVRHLERRAARPQWAQDGQQLVSTDARRRQDGKRLTA